MRSGNWGQAPKGWVTLSADINWEDYGGLWAKRDRHSSSKRAYYVLRFQNMEDYDRQGVRDGFLSRYEAATAWVDLDDTSPETITSALRSCGWELTADGKILQPYDGTYIAEDPCTVDLVILDALAGYGLDWDFETSNTHARRLRASAARGC